MARVKCLPGFLIIIRTPQDLDPQFVEAVNSAKKASDTLSRAKVCRSFENELGTTLPMKYFDPLGMAKESRETIWSPEGHINMRIQQSLWFLEFDPACMAKESSNATTELSHLPRKDKPW